MIIETKSASPGVFFMSLEPDDFARKFEDGKAWMYAIENLKSDIPPDQRSYDSELKLWTIKDTPDNRTIVATIKRVFFEDPNQLGIFGNAD
jgi:hypothetical protein